MNLLEAQKQIHFNVLAGNSTLVQGKSGMGKTSMIFDLFKRRKQELALLNRTAGFSLTLCATLNPMDANGVHFRGTHDFKLPDGSIKTITVTDPSIPLWKISTEGKPAECYDEFWVFFDEYDKAHPDAKLAVIEVLLSGGTGHHSLPSNSVRIAAGNNGARYGSKKEPDHAISRRNRIVIDGNVDVLLQHIDKPYEWAGRVWQTMPTTKAWAKSNPDIVFEEEPKVQGEWCNPRQLCASDRYLQCVLASGMDTKQLADDPYVLEVMSGYIGANAARSRMEHFRFVFELPQIEDVEVAPATTPIPQRADLKLIMAYELAHRANDTNFGAVLQYMSRNASKEWPQDMMITFVNALLRRDYKQFINHPAMIGWKQKNVQLVSLITQVQ